MESKGLTIPEIFADVMWV